MAQRRIGSRKVNITTGAAQALFTATEVQSASNIDPIEVIIRNSDASNRLDFGASDVAAGAGYGIIAAATLSFRIRTPADIPFLTANTATISVEVAWSGPFSGT